MADNNTVLIVDDEENIRASVKFALEKAGFETLEAADGREALKVCGIKEPALIILDIMMPELDGTEVCRQIRAHSNTPIIFLTSRDDEVDRIVGLELGGDDYVPKPFSPRELVARVRAVLRRTRPQAARENAEADSESNIMSHGDLELDLDCHRAYWSGAEIHLTTTEFGILRTLLGYPGKVYTRDELMNGAYPDQNYVSDRTIDSHVRHVRSKFGAENQVIETVHGLGYRLGLCRSTDKG